MIDLTPIANAVISLAALLITTFLIPWIRAKVNAEKLYEIRKWTMIAVEAAEMVYKGSGLGDKKREYVETFLASKGYTLDIASIDCLIESAVREMNIMNPVVIENTAGDEFTEEDDGNQVEQEAEEPEAEEESEEDFADLLI